MKIHSIQTNLVKLPAVETLAGGPMHAALTRDFVTLCIQTDLDVQGIGMGFLFGGNLTAALKQSLDDLCQLIIGRDPLDHSAIHAHLMRAISAGGPEGLALIALSAIDIALWDIKSKVAGLPLAALLGNSHPKVKAYASGALRREYSHDQLIQSANTLLDAGFLQMKMQLGLPGPTSVQRELETARIVRDAVGPQVDLMVDINHQWDLRQALSIGARLEEFGFYWIEDPIARDDYQGMGQITRALSTPIASGEAVFGVPPFRQLLLAGAIDIAMVDVFRVGGITGWMKVAALAEAFNFPVTSHLAPEISVHLVGSVPNGLNVEYIPWSFGLFEDVPRPHAGYLEPFQKPGLGLSFDKAAFSRYGVAPSLIV